jgi:hypothetical protein
MKIKYYAFFGLLIWISNISCREELQFLSKSFESRFVVDGFLSNENPPYTVKLHMSSSIDSSLLLPVTGCNLSIFDDTGNIENLHESLPGIYQTSVNGMKGIVGKQYKLKIITPQGNIYTTEFQEIKSPVKIDSIYTELDYEYSPSFPNGIPGYQFFIDTETAPNNENYYLWNLIETYEYHTDFRLYGIFDGSTILINGADTITKYDDLNICWKTENVKEIFTGKTKNLNIAKITKKPLHFVNTTTKKLTYRYSLLLKQYNITKDSYSFWNGIEEQISNENYLFTTQPYNVVGNIKNEIDPNEVIYGNFTVASVDTMRIFVDRPGVTFSYDVCFLTTNLENYFKRNPPLYFVLLENGNIAGISEPCLDCTSQGGVAKKPSFWIDK